MARPNFQSVDDYIAAQSPLARPVLQRVRATIRKALPRATEGISYQIPVYKVDGAMVLYFAGFQRHYSIFPATARVVGALKKELAGFLHGKASIRFPLAGAVPARLITRIAKLRAAEAGTRVKLAKPRAKPRAFKTRIVRDGSICFIPVPFDPRPLFGKVRAPVKVTLNGYTYRSTIASMGDGPCIPLRRSHREAAGLEGGERLTVTLALDTAKREIKPPPDLVKALRAAPGAWARWRALSYTHQREHVEAIEGAKQPATRARRIKVAVALVA